jgi:osmotically-inducible protein OsmY
VKVKQEKQANIALRDRVERHLECESDVDSTDIGVAAADGIVTLTGCVGCEPQKLAAEKVAKRTFGVKGVANDIIVTPEFEMTDSDIAATAVAALESRANIPSKDIVVIVKDKNIYLDGRVEFNFEKKAAENAVDHICGAKGVINNIEVTPILEWG